MSAERPGEYPLTDEELIAWAASVRWVFAKTRPMNPHWYTLRREQDLYLFQKAVLTIRERGERRKFGAGDYTQYDLDGHTYWSMGAPLECTVLVNRKEL